MGSTAGVFSAMRAIAAANVRCSRIGTSIVKLGRNAEKSVEIISSGLLVRLASQGWNEVTISGLTIRNCESKTAP